MSARPDRPDAARLWAESHRLIEQHFDLYSGAGSRSGPLAQRRLLLALELRWKLEEQLLLPALHKGNQNLQQDARAVEKEIGLLRDLSGVLSTGELPDAAQQCVIAVLEGIAGLRSEQIERALDQATRSRHIDGLALAKDVEAMLERWREELQATGEIEDEEADPVGRPPR